MLTAPYRAVPFDDSDEPSMPPEASVQETLELIQAGGTLAFALLALGALITGRVVPKHVVDDRDRTIAYERSKKDEAYARADAAMASHDRLADAVEARNRLDTERLAAAKEGR